MKYGTTCNTLPPKGKLMMKMKPKLNYATMLEELRDALYVLPQQAIDFAYDFQEFCGKHYSGDYSKKASITLPFKAGDCPFGGDEIYVKYVVRVKSKYVGGPHDDGYYNTTLTVEVKSKYTAGFRSPEVLPWKRK